MAYDKAHFLFDSDGITYGLLLEREGALAVNWRHEDDGYIGTFACFDGGLNLDEAGFDCPEDLFDYFKYLEEQGIEYAVLGVEFDSYNGTFDYCDDAHLWDCNIFIYSTAENPNWNNYETELQMLKHEVKYEEIYNLGLSLIGAIYSIDERYSWEDLRGCDWNNQVVLNLEEPALCSIIPNLETYDWSRDISLEDAKKALEGFNWSYENLRPFE